jgi:hypothetical protein
MKLKKHFFLVLILALVLRFTPIILHEMPVSYDMPFHWRSAKTIIEKQFVPKIDESLGGRPNIYPPLYSIQLSLTHFLTGLNLFFLSTIFLPLISSLIVLSVFILIKKTSNEKNALISSFLIAIASPLIFAAFDSPENIALFFLPAIMLLFYLKKNFTASIIYSSIMFWNYFVLLASLPALFLTLKRKKRKFFLLCISLTIFSLFLIISNPLIFENQNLSIGLQLIITNLKHFLPIILGLTLVLSIPIALHSIKKNALKQFLFWKYFFFMGIISIMVFPLTPILRPWEHLKFMALSISILIGVISSPFIKKFSIIIAALFVITSLLAVTHLIFPKTSKIDLNAFKFLENTEKGSILVEPSAGEFLRNKNIQEKRILTSLYFENEGKNSFLQESIKTLVNQKISKEFAKKTNLKYILLNFEDQALRGTSNYNENKNLNKIFTINYSFNCLLPLSKKIAIFCGKNETKIFAFNENT